MSIKTPARVFVFLSLASFCLYLSLDWKTKRTRILNDETINQILKNSLEKENGSSFLSYLFDQSKTSFLDLSKLGSSDLAINSKISQKVSEEFSNSKRRSFEDRCLTTLNNSIGPHYFKKESQNFEFLKTEEGKKYKKILLYNNAFSSSFYFGLGHKPFETACCKEKRCFVTTNRSVIPVEEFDAILMNFKNINSVKLPNKRKRHQRYVFYEKESPPFSSRNPQDYEGIFNWTMTYRRDSDIVSSIGEIYKKEDFAVEDFSNFESPNSLDSVMKTKNKMVSWFVSDCNPPSKRRDYVKQLQKFIRVYIYGACGPLKCAQYGRDEKCLGKIEKEYKFYLSFENNFCKDYVTEKFFKVMNYYVVPVARGSADYTAIAPPHSYINVDDFKTPKDLANYLIYLDKNNTAYMEYFNWKKDYFVNDKLGWLRHAPGFCTLCQKLHSDKTEKIYYNLTGWFVGEAECNKHLIKPPIPSSTPSSS